MNNRLSALKKQDVKKVSRANEVATSFLSTDYRFPLTIQPVDAGYSLNSWIAGNITQFDKDLHRYGALLCRGFNINTVDKFQQLMREFPQKPLDYKMRSSPRFELASNVYVSTTYPEDQTINMHSESSYAPEHPERITFCCIIPAMEQGETPIADNRLVLQYLSENLKQKFADKGVLYRRHLNPLLGLKWQEVFQTSDKRLVEEECRNGNMHIQWSGEDELTITWKKEAIWSHPVTGELTWFNHALFFNKYMMDEHVLRSVTSDDELPNNTFFGDGTEISQAEIGELKAAYEKATFKFPWEKGDVLFLDNFICSHGRSPYKGERKIVVSIS